MTAKFKRLIEVLMVALILMSIASSARPQTDFIGMGVGIASFTPPAGYIVHGVHLNPVARGVGGSSLDYYQVISNFASAVGKDVGIDMYFRPWDSATTPCDDNYLPRYVDGVGKPGSNPSRAIMITWEPFDPNAYSASNPGPAKYDNILNGSYDTLITTCATQLAAWSNKTFLIRFMHEMNIVDSKWWAGQSYNGNSTDKFKQAWRYVWQKFYDAQTAAGHHNVQWVWAPNYAGNPNAAWNDYNNYYPGDQYVDWIGLSGYNWPPPVVSMSYTSLFDTVLKDLQCRYAKPIMHAEIGSVDYSNPSNDGSVKAAWVTDAYAKLQTYPLVRAIVWFNDYAYHSTAQADFRVWTNLNVGYGAGASAFTAVPANVMEAYKTAVSSSVFTPAFNSANLLNPPMTRCASDSVSTNGVMGARPASAMMGPAKTTTFSVGALGLASAGTLTVSGCPAGATCTPGKTSFAAPWDGTTVTVSSGTAALGSYTLTFTVGGNSTTAALTIANVKYVYLPRVLK